jgi:carboxylesterase
MRGLAQAFADAGFTVELPLLPGHGTTVEEMNTTTWRDWSAAAEAAYTDLSARCAKVVVAGLSMGGTLTIWLATRHPEIAGIVLVNPAAEPMDEATVGFLRQTLADGTAFLPAIGSDIAKEGEVELAYGQTPLAPLLSLVDAQNEIEPKLGDIRTPILLMTSPQDHVVAPSASDYLASKVASPVERVSLDRSYHVATLDHDRDEIERRAVEFARKVTA